ncbi:efflux RND transporter permease subunit [Sporosarcina sp. 179-K 3D1 HS]|uniref:efflux RND transporter permease subunit n=1 Tax=Sporosarcina sp. 179-K 3D1 HS TaxID=3232169 RepID=UPI00399F9435
MKHLVDFSVKRPVGIIMFVMAALVLGMISLKNLAIDLMPEIEVPVAVVATSYDGAAPQEVEELLTRPIEQAVGSIEGLKRINSTSAPGSSLVILEFDWGKKIDSTMNDIREKLDLVTGALPDDAGSPKIIKIDPQATPVMWIGLGGAPLERLQEIAEDEVRPHFERIEGVASVTVEGGKTREIQVELDRAKLAHYNLTGAQVIQAINGENRAASAGNLRRGAQDLQLRIDGEFTSLDDIRNTMISLQDGRTIKVSDVATVEDSFKSMSQIAKVNGEEALVISVMKISDGNSVQVSDNLLKSMPALQERLNSRGMELSVIMDTSDYIRDSISSVVNNMLIGGCLAIGILFLFLRSIRTTIIIAISIPISIIATFTLMYFTGETLNVLSMGGLALGLGMMVDSSIVILENIFTKRQQGYNLVDAAREGAAELAPAVFASTMTTVVVFLPIVFVSGMASQLFRPLSYTVAFALFASLVVSLTIIPMLASKLLGKTKANFGIDNEGKQGRFNLVKPLYKKVLELALRFRKTTVAITFLLIVLSFAVTPFIGAEFIPEGDTGEIQVSVTLQAGVKLEETEAVVGEVDAILQNYKGIIRTSYVGIGSGGGSGFGGGSNIASYMIQLVPSSERTMTTKQLIAELDNKLQDIPGAEFKVTGMDMGLGGGAPVQINITGKDMNVLKDLSQQVMWELDEIDGVANVESSFSEGRPELTIVVKRNIASEYGLSYQQVMNEVTLAFNGQTATRYRHDGSEFDVRVLLPEDSRQSIRDLETMVIRSNKGVDVPLTAVADLSYRQGPTEINRSNQERQMRVTADLRDRDLGSVIKDVNLRIETMNLPDGYQINTGGQADEMADAFMQLTMALALSIFLVYMVMAVQFESFAHPFIIMFSLPTTVIGVLLGLFITGQSLSVPAFIGFIMLAGIVVNNAIILVDYINILRGKGVDLYEAIIQSGLSRLRPILMTTLTTVLGMVPLFLGLGEGTESQRPMAVVIIFGLLFSTVFTLVLIPVLYLMMENVKAKFRVPQFPRFLRFGKRKETVEEN